MPRKTKVNQVIESVTGQGLRRCVQLWNLTVEGLWGFLLENLVKPATSYNSVIINRTSANKQIGRRKRNRRRLERHLQELACKWRVHTLIYEQFNAIRFNAIPLQSTKPQKPSAQLNRLNEADRPGRCKLVEGNKSSFNLFMTSIKVSSSTGGEGVNKP